MTVCQTDSFTSDQSCVACSFVQGPAVSVFEDRSTGQWRQHGSLKLSWKAPFELPKLG